MHINAIPLLCLIPSIIASGTCAGGGKQENDYCVWAHNDGQDHACGDHKVLQCVYSPRYLWDGWYWSKVKDCDAGHHCHECECVPNN
ncbi:unnamed protein product [Zymoseptoria tritici ST99CH_3D7]|uniref:Uncharacterized protein n=1 Tax=Zymoseptoria tritici (strain ST99CH_3D7) TaxID=1276538 RepID=A0A1X7RN28_ZYMT9|nr:unnamed protein product [Zymoseptoria tritici ST99CH_3D7]